MASVGERCCLELPLWRRIPWIQISNAVPTKPKISALHQIGIEGTAKYSACVSGGARYRNWGGDV
jgi:hypothetical protein